MKIATWNVNSVNARLERVLGWFEAETPDVAVLQEIKCVDEKFPAEDFERLGYTYITLTDCGTITNRYIVVAVR